ncbi:hypothetical protein HanPSC8_Chr08g0316281 [Helianthus annuus]|nr:hypothetical protein HanPSC8_Chr08g0316281 [Helianthus annuus]
MLTFCGPSFAYGTFFGGLKRSHIYIGSTKWYASIYVCIFFDLIAKYASVNFIQNGTPLILDLLAKYASVNFIQNGTPSILQSGTRSKSLKMVLALNPSKWYSL